MGLTNPWHLEVHETLLSASVIVFNIIGLFGNVNFVWATIRNKELRNKHGVLMMWFCIFHSVCLLSEFAYIFLDLDHGGVTRKRCFRLAFVHVIAICLQACLSLLISADLLIAMLYPFHHRFFGTNRYVIVMLFPAWTYSLSTAIWGVLTVDNARIPFCNPPLAFSPIVSQWWVGSNVAINCATIVVYMLLYTLILRNGKSSGKKLRRVYSDIAKMSKTVVTERRVLRSLSVVISVYVCSWFTYILGNTIVRDVAMEPRTSYLIQSYLTIFALVCHSQNYYVTFILSHTYRRAFMEQWYMLTCREVPERFWPFSATQSRKASQYWQKTRSEIRSEICTIAGSVTPHKYSVRGAHPTSCKRRTSSLPDLQLALSDVHRNTLSVAQCNKV